MNTSFNCVYNVPMECESCVESVRNALKNVGGIDVLDIDLSSERVTVCGTVPPSAVVHAIQQAGKDAILRGSGAPNSAAVCILETFDLSEIANPIRGLARIVSCNQDQVYFDLTVSGIKPGIYYPQVRSSGNLSDGAYSTGAILRELDSIRVGFADTTNIGQSQTELKNTSGQAFLRADIKVNDLIGRSMVLSSVRGEIASNSLCGVIARSAGAWENDKTVCSCTGKSMWEERAELVGKGLTS